MAAWVAPSTSNPRRTMSWPGQGRGPPTPPGPCQSTSIFAGPTPLLLPSLLRPSSFLRGESLNRIQGAGGSGGSGPNPVPHQAMRSSCQSNPLNFLPRLVVPNKGYSSLDQSPDEKPLVALDTDRCVQGCWGSRASHRNLYERTSGLYRPHLLYCQNWDVGCSSDSQELSKDESPGNGIF